MTPKLHKYLGRNPDRKDDRDFTIEHAGMHGQFGGTRFDRVAAPLPSSVDVFLGLHLPVYDQGELGSCTANAGVLFRRFLAQRFSKYSWPDQDLSRLFLYYQERKLPWNSDTGSDSGAQIRDIFYVLAHLGVCPESVDPYNIELFASEAANSSPADLSGAPQYRVGAYHRVPDVPTARSVLASGYAIALGFTVYESFESISSDGLMPMPRVPGEDKLGGHAVVIRGYDDERRLFFVQNSWSAEWGNRGCFWMPYDFLSNTELSEPDMWIGHLGKPWRN